MTSLTSRLQQRFRQGNVWRQNLVYQSEEDDLDEMTQYSFDRREATISDWGLANLDQPLIDPDVEPQTKVTEGIFADRYRDDITGDIDWDHVRDVLHDEQYSDDYDTKIKAGNAKGCIRRFLFDAAEHDTVLLNTSRGTAIAVFDSPPIYDPGQPQTNVDPGHVFRRSVTFMHDDEGKVITFDNSELPQPLKPNQLTMTVVDRDDLRTVLTHAEALSVLADTMNLVNPD